MDDVDDQHSQRAVVDLVDDAVVSNAEAPAITALQLFAALRPWIVGKGLDRCEDSLVIIFREPDECLLCAPLDADCIQHVLACLSKPPPLMLDLSPGLLKRKGI